MTSFGIVLAVIAMLDALGSDRARRGITAAVIAAVCAAAAVGAYATGHSLRTSLLLAATLVAVEAPLWTYARSAFSAAPALAIMLVALLGRFVTAPLWQPTQPHPLVERWLHQMPPAFAAAGTARIALIVGTALFLVTAGNTVIRLLLRSLPGIGLDRDQRLPGGGRIIGSLERLLIFGLALGGEATAAALVVSAKGVLRFAEVRSAPGEDVDRITEYVLVGSLASYTLAMAFVPLALP